TRQSQRQKIWPACLMGLSIIYALKSDLVAVSTYTMNQAVIRKPVLSALSPSSMAWPKCWLHLIRTHEIICVFTMKMQLKFSIGFRMLPFRELTFFIPIRGTSAAIGNAVL